MLKIKDLTFLYKLMEIIILNLEILQELLILMLLGIMHQKTIKIDTSLTYVEDLVN